MADTPLSSYPLRTLTHVLGHDGSGTPLVGKMAVSGLGGGGQPLDGDLTAISALTGTGYARRTGADTWTLDTPSGGGATVLVSDTAPDIGTTPVNSLFWESDTGIMYILYDDGSSVQWVAVGESSGAVPGGVDTQLQYNNGGVFDGVTGSIVAGDGSLTVTKIMTPFQTPQTNFAFDVAVSTASTSFIFGDIPVKSDLDQHYNYTGPAPTGYDNIGPSFYTIAEPSTNVDNHFASYSGISGTVYCTSATTTCNLIGGKFTAFRALGSTNPIFGVVGTAVCGDPTIGSFIGDGGTGGLFSAWVNAGSQPGASGTDAFEINGGLLSGKAAGVVGKCLVTTGSGLKQTLSIGALGLSQVQSEAANSIGGWFGAKGYSPAGVVGNKFGVLIDDISGALNLNMALRTGLGAVQFGGSVAAPSGFVGNVTVAQMGTTAISSVHGGAFGKYSYDDTGTKTYTYKVVPVFAGGVTGPASAAVSTAFGFDDLSVASHNNIITFAPVIGAVGGYDIYRTAAGGTTTNTTGKIGNCPQHITPVVSGNSMTPTTPSFVDVGQVGDGSTAPATDTTGVVTATRFAGANFSSVLQGLAPASGGGTTNFLRADGTWAAAGGGSIAPLQIIDANTVHQRNGGNAQSFSVYNTYTDASNYERGVFSWASGILTIGSQRSGSGSRRPTYIVGSDSGNDYTLQVGYGGGGFVLAGPSSSLAILNSNVAGVHDNFIQCMPGVSGYGYIENWGGLGMVIGSAADQPVIMRPNRAETARFNTAGMALTARAFSAVSAFTTAGLIAYIDDSTANTVGATITGGGSSKVLGWYNGTAWKVFAI